MRKFNLILGITLMVIGILCLVAGGIGQMYACYEKFGVIFSSHYVFIPYWTDWFFLGEIPVAIGWVILYLGD